jgi:hypothetical protein
MGHMCVPTPQSRSAACRLDGPRGASVLSGSRCPQFFSRGVIVNIRAKRIGKTKFYPVSSDTGWSNVGPPLSMKTAGRKCHPSSIAKWRTADGSWYIHPKKLCQPPLVKSHSILVTATIAKWKGVDPSIHPSRSTYIYENVYIWSYRHADEDRLLAAYITFYRDFSSDLRQELWNRESTRGLRQRQCHFRHWCVYADYSYNQIEVSGLKICGTIEDHHTALFWPCWRAKAATYVYIASSKLVVVVVVRVLGSDGAETLGRSLCRPLRLRLRLR